VDRKPDLFTPAQRRNDALYLRNIHTDRTNHLQTIVSAETSFLITFLSCVVHVNSSEAFTYYYLESLSTSYTINFDEDPLGVTYSPDASELQAFDTCTYVYYIVDDFPIIADVIFELE